MAKLPARDSAQPKVALVHDWLVSRGGAERVLEAFHELWPDAPIYTAAYSPEKFPEFADADVRPTWLDKIGLAKRKHQLFSLPRMLAFAMTDLSDYDLVINSCSAEAKFVRIGQRTLEVCYCYTPVRYYWSDYEWYRAHPPFGPGLNQLAKYVVLPVLLPVLRRLDYRQAQKVTAFITQSRYIQGRIKRYYHRDVETIINPPVDVERFKGLPKHEGGYYLVVGRQVAYKRLDLAVDAFNELGLPLVVAGTGEEIGRQTPRSKKNIDYRGFVPEDELPQLYADAKAVLYPQEEDFGLVPVEAMAAGTPVIAFGVGGAAETVVDGQTGVLFKEQTPESLIAAVRRFEKLQFDPAKLVEHAEKFSEDRFKREIKAFVDKRYAEWRKDHRA